MTNKPNGTPLHRRTSICHIESAIPHRRVQRFYDASQAEAVRLCRPHDRIEQAIQAREADQELAARLEGTLDYGSQIPIGRSDDH